MFKPTDPLAPRDEVFDEAWHAQTLAIADAMIQAGHITANDWAEALGTALRDAEMRAAADTGETYYTAALNALETLTAKSTTVNSNDLATRKADWESAYRHTPHGQPVHLGSE